VPRTRKTTTTKTPTQASSLRDSIIAKIEGAVPADILGAPHDFISTRCLAIDLALRMPGAPVGRLTVIRGWEQAAKSTLGLHLCQETLQRGGVAVLLDTEFAYDEYRSQKMGINTNENDPDGLIVRQPQTIEDTIKLIEEIIEATREESPDTLLTIVWDSVAATDTAASLENEFGESQRAGAHASLMRQALRRISKKIAQSQVCLVIINQNSEAVNMGPWAGMGNTDEKDSMVAKRPLQFYASVIINMYKAGELKRGSGDKVITYGVKVKGKVVKNKCSHPFGTFEAHCLFDTGFDNDYAYFETALKLGMLIKRGSYYRLPDSEKSFTEATFGAVLDETLGLREKILDAARETLWPLAAKEKYLNGVSDPAQESPTHEEQEEEEPE